MSDRKYRHRGYMDNDREPQRRNLSQDRNQNLRIAKARARQR